MPTGALTDLAGHAAERCQAAGAVLIVNDRADVARMTSAHGVHVGQGDLSPRDVRSIVGEASVLGLSTHNDAQVRIACEEPISYLAIGPVFATSTKEAPVPVVGLAGVTSASRHARASGLPTVAIGGITLAVAPQVVESGAAAVAVTSDLLPDQTGVRVADVAIRAKQYMMALA
jgi:thiamine-phosphate pyrophosphorylase